MFDLETHNSVNLKLNSENPTCKKERQFWCNPYLMFFGVGDSCRNLYSFVGYSYVSDSGSITSVGEESAVCYCLLVIMWFLLERFPLPLGTRDGLRYFCCGTP